MLKWELQVYFVDLDCRDSALTTTPVLATLARNRFADQF